MLEAHHLSRSTCPNVDLEAFPRGVKAAGSASSLRSSLLDFQFSTCPSDEQPSILPAQPWSGFQYSDASNYGLDCNTMSYDDKSTSVDEDMIIPSLLINNNNIQQQSLWPVSDDFYGMKYLDDEVPNPYVSPPPSRPTDIHSSWISSPFSALGHFDFYHCGNYSAYLNAQVQGNTSASWNLEVHSQPVRLS